MTDVLIILFMIALCFAAVMIIPTMMAKRAMVRIIRIMRISGAVDPENAKTRAELRLNPPSFTEKFITSRDYKSKTLDLLISMDIVQLVEDRIYLSEKDLLSSPLVQRWPSLSKGIDS